MYWCIYTILNISEFTPSFSWYLQSVGVNLWMSGLEHSHQLSCTDFSLHPLLQWSPVSCQEDCSNVNSIHEISAAEIGFEKRTRFSKQLFSYFFLYFSLFEGVRFQCIYFSWSPSVLILSWCGSFILSTVSHFSLWAWLIFQWESIITPNPEHPSSTLQYQQAFLSFLPYRGNARSTCNLFEQFCVIFTTFPDRSYKLML